MVVMSDVQRDLHVLVSIAKVDAALNDIRKELGLLPVRLEKIRKSIGEVEGRESEAQGHVEEMAKERREVEQQLQDNEEKIKKLRVQLMQVKTNKEYTAMLHEIAHVEKDTGEKEERLLVLMDELEQETDQNGDGRWHAGPSQRSW